MSGSRLRQFFPCFNASNGMANLVYFDNAATTQKPESVIRAIQDYYLNSNVNVHRSTYQQASATTEAFERTRIAVQSFIGAKDKDEIIFTKGTTEAINLVATVLAEGYFMAGKRILISSTEHHANLVPWQLVAKRLNMYLDVLPVDDLGRWQLDKGLALIGPDTQLVALGHVSNTLGTVNPIERLIAKARSVGALSLIDGAQAVAHLDINVASLGCDFYTFSAHKAYGPTGVGVLYATRQVLANLPVYQSGGEMVRRVSFDETEFADLPYRYEAGTPNIEGVIAFEPAIRFLRQQKSIIERHEQHLSRYLEQKLAEIEGIRLFGDEIERIATRSFTVRDCNAHDIGVLLDQHRIAVRVGSHCTMPLLSRLGVEATIRVSLACYNTIEEIDYFTETLKDCIAQLTGNPVEENLNAEANNESWGLPLAAKIRTASGWDGKYRQIMLAGKALNAKSNCDYLCTDRNRVSGCESSVWVSLVSSTGQPVKFDFYADSKIVRGLLAILFEPIQGKLAFNVKDFDFYRYMTELGLQQHLTESRANGIASVIKRIGILLTRSAD